MYVQSRFGWWCVALAQLVCLSSVQAGDWPQFRGPTAQGLTDAKRLPVKWSETENVVWKSAIPGLGWSSPVIRGNQLFVTTAVPEEGEAQSLRLCSVDIRTGELQWNHELFRTKGKLEFHKKNSHASASPVIDGERIYVHFGPYGTAAVDLQGKVLWKNTELQYGPQHGIGGSPALWNNRLVICCDGHDKQFVVGLDTADGSIAWKTERNAPGAPGFSFGTPLIIDVDGQAQAVCPGSGAIVAYDPANGNELWRVKHANWSVVPRPLYANGKVLATTGYMKSKLLAIDPTGRGDITDSHVKWTIERGISLNPSPVVVDGSVYVISDEGILTCADLETGKINWTQRIGGKFSTSLLFAEGRIYAQSEEGKVTIFKPGAEYEEIAVNEYADGLRTYASYAAIDGALFLRSESHLYRVGEPVGTVNR